MSGADLLRCAGCNRAGRKPTIIFDRSQEDPLPVLVPSFDWHGDGRAALLCRSCRALLAHRRKRGPKLGMGR